MVAMGGEKYDWGLLDLNVPDAHKKTLGENIKICVIDSGKPNHFELDDAIAEYKNFTDGDSVDDKLAHASFVSGILAAKTNDEGIIGVAPKSKLYIAKALNDDGTGDPAFTTNAVAWAIEQKVDLINISAGMFFDFRPLYQQVKRAYDENIIILSATGNTSNRYYDVAYPARYTPECIGVGSYSKNRKYSSFSSTGANVAFSMPGKDIYSCGLNNTFMKSSGSSFSCPIMTGVCALILARHKQVKNPSTPCETPQQMLEHLKKYAVDLGEHNKYGFGTINLTSALSET